MSSKHFLMFFGVLVPLNSSSPQFSLVWGEVRLEKLRGLHMPLQLTGMCTFQAVT